MKLIRSIIFIFFIILCSCTKKNKSLYNNIFRYNESSSITSLDPLFANTQSNIWATNQIFNTLVYLDSNMVIQPLIAKDWLVKNDGHKYVFILRDDVYYHKSECFGSDSTRKVVAKDFVYSLSRLNNNDLISPGRWVLDYFNLDEVVAVNDTLLEINLPKPFSRFFRFIVNDLFFFCSKRGS